ncbi:hypothetical protein M9H77_18385 [Catharanthus roseus]|uniref:Uncharacterized protein n=1 Tax=Catharanthus roseus TaxID=4058 RepID=A0ACC0B7D0_CATRO|nr:hypothetical protein M9H77_18385 [Catharanthus roseus]
MKSLPKLLKLLNLITLINQVKILNRQHILPSYYPLNISIYGLSLRNLVLANFPTSNSKKYVKVTKEKIEKCHAGTGIPRPYPGPWRVRSGAVMGNVSGHELAKQLEFSKCLDNNDLFVQGLLSYLTGVLNNCNDCCNCCEEALKVGVGL